MGLKPLGVGERSFPPAEARGYSKKLACPVLLPASRLRGADLPRASARGYEGRPIIRASALFRVGLFGKRINFLFAVKYNKFFSRMVVFL